MKQKRKNQNSDKYIIYDITKKKYQIISDCVDSSSINIKYFPKLICKNDLPQKNSTRKLISEFLYDQYLKKKYKI